MLTRLLIIFMFLFFSPKNLPHLMQKYYLMQVQTGLLTWLTSPWLMLGKLILKSIFISKACSCTHTKTELPTPQGESPPRFILPPFSWWFVFLYSFKSSGSNFIVHQSHMEGLSKCRLLDSTPRILDALGLEWVWDFALVTSSWMMFMLLVQGPHLENHCFRWWFSPPITN